MKHSNARNAWCTQPVHAKGEASCCLGWLPGGGGHGSWGGLIRLAAYSVCSRGPSSQECIYIPRRRRCKRPHCGSCMCGCSSGPSGRADKLKRQHTWRALLELWGQALAEQIPPTPPHLLACQRSAVSIGTENAHCSSLIETQMAMLTGTAAIVVDAHIPSQMAEWKSSQVYKFSYLRNAHSALCAQDCSGNRREQRMRQSPHYLLEAYILVEEADIPTSQPKNQWY